MGLLLLAALSICFIIWMYHSAVLVDENNVPVPKKRKK